MPTNSAHLSERRRRLVHLAAEVDRSIKCQDFANAIRVSESAVAEGLAHPIFLNLLAYREMQEDHPDRALSFLGQARVMAPKDPTILSAIGTCYAKLLDTASALVAFGESIAVAPGFAPAYYNRGLIYDSLGDLSLARLDFERAVALEPRYPEALAKLAYDAAVRGAVAQARDFSTRALALAPQETTAIIAIAMTDMAEGYFSAARNLLVTNLESDWLTPHNRAVFFGLLGDALDGLNQTNEAFASYSKSNKQLQTIYRDQVTNAAPERPRAQIYRIIAYFAQTTSADWRPPSDSALQSGAPPQAFIVGFPRSGTTLLEQALAGHPDVVTSEEAELLSDAVAEFITPTDGLERLERLSTEDACRFRNAYQERRALIAPSSKYFIDKLPLGAVLLPVVAKIFPDAKVLFARRDPRDVVFSCFRRRFAITPQMYELLTLEDTARYYDAVMRLTDLYREKLTLDWTDVTYEKVVAQFGGEMRAICAFLGLEWHRGIEAFGARLATRSVDTPSSAQLVKGLNRDSIGTWTRYKDQMETILPLLDPWVRRFSYS